MAAERSNERFLVDGMTCSHCEQRIEQAVKAIDGVHLVSASAPLSEVTVYYDSDRASRAAIVEAITGAGYQVRGDQPVAAPMAAASVAATCGVDPGTAAPPASAPRASSVYRFLGLIAVVVAVYLIIRYTVGFAFLPTVSQSMGYGLIFVVGLLTSLHCIAMCGGIVLSQGISKREEQPAVTPPSLGVRLVPSLLYNGGRVISYTIIGGGVGALGSLFSLSTTLKGIMPVVAGVFMLFLGVRMLGIFPWLSRLKVRLPSIGGDRIAAALGNRGGLSGIPAPGRPSPSVARGGLSAVPALGRPSPSVARGPFVVGLLNGLMPCGPLQTMQVYALGTGSFFAGALSMFLFSLGTVPLLLGFGLISSLLSAKFNRRMLKASGVLVMALGFVMFTRGLSLFGVSLPSIPSSAVAVARLSSGYQEVRTTVESGQYHPFVVQAGVPVRWTISAKADELNGCNNPVTIPQYGIRRQLVAGDNLIEFTPQQAGTITYTCWMGMISSTIRVVPDLAKVAAADLVAPPAGSGAGASAGGCCAAPPPGFAGGKIPVDVVQVATITEAGQVADVLVGAQGYSPAVIVMKRGVKGKVRFTAGSLSVCNSVVNFPDYGGGLDLRKGQLETPFLTITRDFTFECGMGMLHGFVKVVDDPSSFDVEAVKREVAAFKPAAGSGGCCGQ